jgi:hypothetical protein
MGTLWSRTFSEAWMVLCKRLFIVLYCDSAPQAALSWSLGIVSHLLGMTKI